MCIAETVGDAAIQKSLELSSTHHSGTIVMIVDRQASDRAACGQTRAAGSRERSLELSSTHHSGTIVMIVDRQESDRAACGQTRAAGSRERYSQAATGGSGGSRTAVSSQGKSGVFVALLG